MESSMIVTYRKVAENPADFLKKTTLLGRSLFDWIQQGLDEDNQYTGLDFQEVMDSVERMGVAQEALYVQEVEE